MGCRNVYTYSTFLEHQNTTAHLLTSHALYEFHDEEPNKILGYNWRGVKEMGSAPLRSLPELDGVGVLIHYISAPSQAHICSCKIEADDVTSPSPSLTHNTCFGKFHCFYYE